MRNRWLTLALPALMLLAQSASSHELQENRAQIVLRDKIHLSVTIYLNYTEALHLALAPQRPYAAFLVVYSSMKLEDLQLDMLMAQARFQAATKMVVSPGGEASLTNWIWPEAKQVQALLQQQVMQAMVDPASHKHEPPLEVHAEATVRAEPSSVRIQFPEAYRRVLTVAFRPSQQWAEPKTLSPELKF